MDAVAATDIYFSPTPSTVKEESKRVIPLAS